MVYKRYIKVKGRVCGPYYYESYRDKNGKVVSRYLPNYKPPRKLKLPSKKTLFFVLGLIFFIFIMLLIGNINYHNYNSGLSGKAVQEVSYHAEEVSSSDIEIAGQIIENSVKSDVSSIDASVDNANRIMEFDTPEGKITLDFDLLNYSEWIESSDEKSISAEDFEANVSENKNRYKWGYDVILKDLNFMARIDVRSKEKIVIVDNQTLKIGMNYISFSDLASQGYILNINEPVVLEIENLSSLDENMSLGNETLVNISQEPEISSNLSEENLTGIISNITANLSSNASTDIIANESEEVISNETISDETISEGSDGSETLADDSEDSGGETTPVEIPPETGSETGEINDENLIEENVFVWLVLKSVKFLSDFLISGFRGLTLFVVSESSENSASIFVQKNFENTDYKTGDAINLDPILIRILGGTATNGSIVYRCGTINESGSYSLNQSLNSSGTCLTISASHVVLEGNNHLINGSSSASTYGIFSNNTINITLQNINVSRFESGVYLYNSNNSLLNNITSSNNLNNGIYLYHVNNSNFYNINSHSNIQKSILSESISGILNRLIYSNSFGMINFSDKNQNEDSCNNPFEGILNCTNQTSCVANLGCASTWRYCNGTVNFCDRIDQNEALCNDLGCNFYNQNCDYYTGANYCSEYLNSGNCGTAGCDWDGTYNLCTKSINAPCNDTFQCGYIDSNSGCTILGGGSGECDDSTCGNSDSCVAPLGCSGTWIKRGLLSNLTIINSLSFPGTIEILNNSAYVNSNNFSGERINSSAEITLNNLQTNFATPSVLRDGIYPCLTTTIPSCFNFTSLNAGNVRFNVSSFSNYSIQEVNASVDSCGELLFSNKIYVQTRNLNYTSSGGYCITISASNVTYDCNGYSITGGAQSVLNSGIYSYNQNQITIKNCNISKFEIYGVYLQISNDSSFINNNVVYDSNSLSNALFTGYRFSINNNNFSLLNLNNVQDSNILNNRIGTNSANYGGGGIGDSNNNTFVNNTFSSFNTSVQNANGFSLSLSDNNTFSNCNFSNWNTGLYITNSHSNLFKNSVFKNSLKDIFSQKNEYADEDSNSKNNTFLNCSYDKTKESIDSGSSLIRLWYYKALVTDNSSTPMGNASVLAYNITGSPTMNLTTNASGWTPVGQIMDYINTGGTRVYQSSYIMSANSNNSLWDSHNFNVTDYQNYLNDSFVVKLDLTAPNISGSEWTSGTDNVVIRWTTSEGSNSSVTYWASPAQTIANNLFVINHAVTLTGLDANTSYNYYYTSCDFAGNCVKSSNYSFSTTAGGTGSGVSGGGSFCIQNWKCGLCSGVPGQTGTQDCWDDNNCGVKPRTQSCIVPYGKGALDIGAGTRGLESPSSSSSGCFSNFECENWGNCKLIYNLEDIVGEKVLFKGIQERKCVDANKCSFDKTEKIECDVKKPVIAKKVLRCFKYYLEIYETGAMGSNEFKENITGELISRLELESSGKKFVNKSSNLLNVQMLFGNEYCPYCYDKIKNYDEDEIDCMYKSGGSCPACKTESPSAKRFDFRIILLIAFGFAILLIIYYLIDWKRMKKKKRR